jgi:hypothetical protein
MAKLLKIAKTKDVPPGQAAVTIEGQKIALFRPVLEHTSFYSENQEVAFLRLASGRNSATMIFPGDQGKSREVESRAVTRIH